MKRRDLLTSTPPTRRLPQSRRFAPRLLAPILLVPMLLPACALAGPWPLVDHPAGAHVEDIGQQVRVNGIPMRMTRTRAPAPAGELVAHYRQALGAPVAHSRVGDTAVLAQERGDFFITVAISPHVGSASEALISVADMPAARDAAGRPTGFVLPADSELLSDVESIDGRVGARQLVVTNTHGLHANLARFSASLADRGLAPDGPALADSDEVLVQGFAGPAGEARLVLVRRDGATSAVLTLLTRHP